MIARPIPYSPPMVEARRKDYKTQTRRLALRTSQPDKVVICDFDREECLIEIENRHSGVRTWKPCPFGVPGDRLWVKEEHYLFGIWRIHGRLASGKPKYRFEIDREMGVHFDTMPNGTITGGRSTEVHGWYKRTGMFMPRWASRGLDEVVSVHAERLQGISEIDAMAEGCVHYEFANYLSHGGWSHDGRYVHPTAIASFKQLWDSINGAGSWDANPWVWRVEFKVITP